MSIAEWFSKATPAGRSLAAQRQTAQEVSDLLGSVFGQTVLREAKAKRDAEAYAARKQLADERDTITAELEARLPTLTAAVAKAERAFNAAKSTYNARAAELRIARHTEDEAREVAHRRTVILESRLAKSADPAIAAAIDQVDAAIQEVRQQVGLPRDAVTRLITTRRAIEGLRTQASADVHQAIAAILEGSNA